MNQSVLYLLCILVAVNSYKIDSTSSRVANGEFAKPKQFPWQVSIQTPLPGTDYSRFCSGAIIDKRWVLTSAQCLQGGVRIYLRMGGTAMIGEDWNKLVMVATDLVRHENFDESSNDIALIKLDEDIPFSDYVQPIQLPKRGEVIGDGQDATAIGWGYQGAGLGNFLTYASLKSISNNACEEIYGSLIRDYTLCANSDEVQNICRGDSGGPLVQHNSDATSTLVGIASVVDPNECGKSHVSTFMRTESFLEWIHEKTGLDV